MTASELNWQYPARMVTWLAKQFTHRPSCSRVAYTLILEQTAKSTPVNLGFCLNCKKTIMFTNGKLCKVYLTFSPIFWPFRNKTWQSAKFFGQSLCPATSKNYFEPWASLLVDSLLANKKSSVKSKNKI